mgnify:FL=1
MCIRDRHRSDRYFFHKLGKRYDKELREFLVSNFSKEDSVNPKGLLSNQDEENYTEWKKKNQSISRLFDQELKKCLDIFDSFGIMFVTESRNSHPPIVKMIQSDKIQIQSAIILDHYLNWIDYVEREVDDEWIWPRIRNMLRKCQPFIKFNETKCKEILKNRVESVVRKT